MKTQHIELGEKSYDILIGQGLLADIGSLLPLGRRVLIVTDDGVPAEYAEAVAKAAGEAYTVTLPAGEASKSLASFEKLLRTMLENGFGRGDCAVAVGGGVVGDLCGFAASAYMRGIDFYNIPTTVLSMVDSSVGGKNAVNLDGVKNIVGAFYQPKKVIADCDVLRTLPPRQIASGLAEAVKMALTSDEEGFTLFEKEELPPFEEIISRAIAVKAAVVAEDEKENGLRRILNFGHTFGHALEAYEGLGGLTHGECVAIGMLPMCSPAVRKRLLPVLCRLGLPTEIPAPAEKIFGYLQYDKKRVGDEVYAVTVDDIGDGKIRKIPLAELEARVTAYEKERQMHHE